MESKIIMTKYGLLPVFGDEFSQRVKGTMRFLPTHTIPHPLGNDFLFSLVHGTSRVLREPKIRHVGQRIEIRKKDGVSRLWPHVDVSILKIGKSALRWKGTKRNETSWPRAKQKLDKNTWAGLNFLTRDVPLTSI